MTTLSRYLAQHNLRFAVAPANEQDAHVAYTGSAQALARICAIHHGRKLSKDLVVSFMRQRFTVQTGGLPRYALRGQPVTVVLYPDQRLNLLYRQEVLPFKVFDPLQHVAMPVDDKTLNARVDEVLRQRQSRPVRRADHTHPWRRWEEQNPPPAQSDSATP